MRRERKLRHSKGDIWNIGRRVRSLFDEASSHFVLLLFICLDHFEMIPIKEETGKEAVWRGVTPATQNHNTVDTHSTKRISWMDTRAAEMTALLKADEHTLNVVCLWRRADPVDEIHRHALFGGLHFTEWQQWPNPHLRSLMPPSDEKAKWDRSKTNDLPKFGGHAIPAMMLSATLTISEEATIVEVGEQVSVVDKAEGRRVVLSSSHSVGTDYNPSSKSTKTHQVLLNPHNPTHSPPFTVLPSDEASVKVKEKANEEDEEKWTRVGGLLLGRRNRRSDRPTMTAQHRRRQSTVSTNSNHINLAPHLL
ncbi:hypothetical protein BLNAU_19929 [Blattamonas nauphoetae]|uniref:Uncharacterized protein n=1 Tax=Blattamonas nauphoetae TaxID=2049346 RepID=A0ABQ9X054_9EUKA|nr:hypothetical protein BLNAU_19929 [Blattamonas nauphoetae]